MPRKTLVNTKRNLLMPNRHPIILLKSNLLNMAAVSVKRSVVINACTLKQSQKLLHWKLPILPRQTSKQQAILCVTATSDIT